MGHRGCVVQWACLLLLVSCGQAKAPEEPPQPVTASRPAIIAARAVATDKAFDFLVSEQGAMLIWSPPASDGGGVRLLPLDGFGSSSGHERVVMYSRLPNAAPVDAFVVRAARVREELAVVWVERQVGNSPVLVTVGASVGGVFPEPKTLANLKIVRGSEPSKAIAFATTPTDELGVWVSQDEACSRRDRPVEGACPLGTVFDVAGLFAGTAGNDSRAQDHAAASARPSRSEALASELPAWTRGPGQRTMRCERGKLSVRFVSREGESGLTMGRAIDRIEDWLPSNLVPQGARALWTGHALLVVAPEEGDLSLRRYECIHNQFTRTDLLSRAWGKSARREEAHA